MYSIDYLYQIFGGFENFLYFCAPKRRGARVVEEARLESVYTPKGYPGFESPSLRWKELQNEERRCVKMHTFIILRTKPRLSQAGALLLPKDSVSLDIRISL